MKTKQILLVFFLLVLLAVAIVPGANAASLTVNGAGPCDDGTGSPAYCTIQAAIDDALGGDTITVLDGTYTENLTINKNVILLSQNGRSTTTIEGISSVGALGAIVVTSNTTALQIGDTGQGFTIVGIDNGTPGIENAAVYFQGSHSGAVVRDNEIQANGDAGLLTEYGATIDSFVIDANEFSGQTFVGAEPGDCGFSNQFTAPNVPRQLVVMGNGGGDVPSANTTNITFTDNDITGTAGGASTVAGCEDTGQGNTLVTLDAANSTITGNSFAGTTARYATSLRVRRPGTTITSNDFDSSNLTPLTGHIFFQNASTFTMGSLVGANTFDKGVYTDPSATNGTLGIALKPAVTAVPGGTTIYLLAGTYVESGQIEIDKDITIVGADKATTIINTDQDTGSSGDARGWFLVTAAGSLDLSGVTLDGSGYKVYQAIRDMGTGSTISDVAFTEIKFNESGPTYSGVAIAAFGSGPVNVSNSMFSEIGRIGILYYGSGVSGSTFDGNSYTGKGTGDFLDYALDISAGVVVNVTNNNVSGNKGVASSDGSTSAGFLVSTYFAPGTTATFSGNNISDNTTGIAVGYDGSDTSLVTANDNCISGNDTGVSTTAPPVDATSNWWGDASGPYNATNNPTGTGDPVDDNVDIDSWLDACGGSATGNFYNVTADTYHATMQSALDSASPGDVIEPVGTGPFGSEGSANVTTGGITINLNGGTFGPGSPAFTISAPDVTINGPGTLDGGGSGNPAILVTTGGDNFTLQGVEVKNWEDGVQIDSSVVSFKLVENFIHDNTDAGLQVDTAVALSGIITIEGNLFKDNGGNGVENASGVPLDAKYNSWGIDTGPDFGDGISDDVNAEPWTFAEIFFDVDPPADAIQRDISEDETFDVGLVVDGENLYGLSFLFTYDPDLLTLDNTVFASPWDGRCLPIAGSPGTVEYVCNLLSEPEWDGGTLATFTFTADLPGTAPGDDGPWQNLFDISHLETDTSAGAVGGVKVFVNNAGFNAPTVPDRDITDTNDGQIDIDGTANYTGFVDLQGKPNDSGAMITVYNQAAKAGATALADATSAASGYYLTSYIPPYLLNVGMTYWFQIDAPRYLPTTAVMMEPASMTPIPTDYQHSHILDDRPETTLNNVILLGGDSTDNDVIDINDASCIGASYEALPGSWTCTGGPGASADVNDDTVVNILDLVLMGGNYELAASPWTP